MFFSNKQEMPQENFSIFFKKADSLYAMEIGLSLLIVHLILLDFYHKEGLKK